MKRMSLALGVALALAVATLAGIWAAGSHSASAQGFNDGLKCYRAKVLGSANPNNRLIYVQDQYEAKNLIVKKPTEFCALADKEGVQVGGAAGGLEGYHLVCYATKDAPRQPKFQRQEVLTEDQFGVELLQLTKPYSLCEQATKQTNGASAGFDQHPFEDFSFRCYKVRRLENGRFEKIQLELIDQFSVPEGKQTRLLRPDLFCSRVEEKKRKAKNDDIENARELVPNEEVHVSTISTTSDRSDPDLSCVGAYGHTVWYTYTPSGDEYIGLDSSFSTYDTVMGLFRGTPGEPDFEEFACDDDSGLNGAARIETKIAGGETYHIVVGAYGGTAAGKLKLLLLTDEFECIGVCGGGTTAATTVVDQDAEGGDAGASVFNMTCYTISQRAPDDAQIHTFDQLNEHTIELGRGTMYCVRAEKCAVIKEPGGGIISIGTTKCQR